MRSHIEEINWDIVGTWLVVFIHLVQDASRGTQGHLLLIKRTVT